MDLLIGCLLEGNWLKHWLILSIWKGIFQLNILGSINLIPVHKCIYALKPKLLGLYYNPESKKADISFCGFLPFWPSSNKFRILRILSHTAYCLLRKPSEHYIPKARQQCNTRKEWMSFPIFYGQWLWYWRHRILSSEATNSNSCIKNHHDHHQYHHHHHCYLLTT